MLLTGYFGGYACPDSLADARARRRRRPRPPSRRHRRSRLVVQSIYPDSPVAARSCAAAGVPVHRRRRPTPLPCSRGSAGREPSTRTDDLRLPAPAAPVADTGYGSVRALLAAAGRAVPGCPRGARRGRPARRRPTVLPRTGRAEGARSAAQVRRRRRGPGPAPTRRPPTLRTDDLVRAAGPAAVSRRAAGRPDGRRRADRRVNRTTRASGRSLWSVSAVSSPRCWATSRSRWRPCPAQTAAVLLLSLRGAAVAHGRPRPPAGRRRRPGGTGRPGDRGSPPPIPEIAELEVNPARWCRHRARSALDARAVRLPAESPAPTTEESTDGLPLHPRAGRPPGACAPRTPGC